MSLLNAIRLSITPGDTYVQLHSDIGKLERILSNLIDNALRHTPEGGDITLEISCGNEGECSLIVKDNGSGIKAEELAYIFDARYRASNATHSKGKNVGLGLAITHKLAELMKLDIRVQSTFGEGTSFSLNLRSATSV